MNLQRTEGQEYAMLYVFGICHRACLDSLRYHHIHHDLPTQQEVPLEEPDFLTHPRQASVKADLAKLPDTPGTEHAPRSAHAPEALSST